MIWLKTYVKSTGRTHLNWPLWNFNNKNNNQRVSSQSERWGSEAGSRGLVAWTRLRPFEWGGKLCFAFVQKCAHKLWEKCTFNYGPNWLTHPTFMLDINYGNLCQKLDLKHVVFRGVFAGEITVTERIWQMNEILQLFVAFWNFERFGKNWS